MKTFDLAKATFLLFFLASISAGQVDTKRVPVLIDGIDAHGPLSATLVFRIREAIRSSTSLILVTDDAPEKIRVVIMTVPLVSDGSDDAIIVSAAFIFESRSQSVIVGKKLPLWQYLDTMLGTCADATVTNTAERIVAHIDSLSDELVTGISH